MATTQVRLCRCRYTDLDGRPCSAEAVDANEIRLCTKHLALVVELLQRRAS